MALRNLPSVVKKHITTHTSKSDKMVGVILCSRSRYCGSRRRINTILLLSPRFNIEINGYFFFFFFFSSSPWVTWWGNLIIEQQPSYKQTFFTSILQSSFCGILLEESLERSRLQQTPIRQTRSAYCATPTSRLQNPKNHMGQGGDCTRGVPELQFFLFPKIL